MTCVTARSVSGSGCGAKLETVIAFSTFNKLPRSKSRPLAAHKTKWNDCVTEPQSHAIAKTKLMVHSCKYIVAHAYPLARSDRRKPQRSKMSTPTAHLISHFFTMPRKQNALNSWRSCPAIPRLLNGKSEDQDNACGPKPIPSKRF